MSAPQRINTDKELEIVSMIARGDKQIDIAEEMQVAVSTVTAIKMRNHKALAMIEQKMAEYKARKTARLLDKSHTLIEKKLDAAETAEEKQEELWQKYQDNEISLKEYTDAIKGFDKLTLTELTAVSKEMKSQSESEERKLGGAEGTTTKADAQVALDGILEAMKSGDAVTLQQIVFTPKED